VRIALWSVLFTTLCLGDVLDDSVKKLLDARHYKVNERFIGMLFKDRSQFVDERGVDWLKVSQTLKDNGLLSLFFKAPREFKIQAQTRSTPALFLRSLTSALSFMGYYYVTTTKVEQRDGLFSVTLALTTEHAVDPMILLQEFDRRGYRASEVARQSDTMWTYLFDLKEVKMPEAEIVNFGEEREMTRVSGEYWVAIQGGGALSVLPRGGGSWYPYIALYDSKMVLLKIETLDVAQAKTTLPLEAEARFARIVDLHTGNNLRSGIKVSISR